MIERQQLVRVKVCVARNWRSLPSVTDRNVRIAMIMEVPNGENVKAKLHTFITLTSGFGMAGAFNTCITTLSSSRSL